MKKVILSWVLSLCMIGSSFADCFFEEIDPVCSISGYTYTSTCEGWSDTSSWSMPIAYSGECKTKSSISQEEKDKIFTIMDDFFTKHEMKGHIYGIVPSIYPKPPQDSYNTLNPKWQKFIDEVLFPALQKYIQKEVIKKNPNNKNIAVLNYVASMIGYDYTIQR